LIRRVGREEVRRMLMRGVRVLEVLPREDYEEEHIRAAVSLPLGDLTWDSVSQLDRKQPVVVYCWDSA
jgi:rhodanese-related sulfurtransferase